MVLVSYGDFYDVCFFKNSSILKDNDISVYDNAEKKSVEERQVADQECYNNCLIVGVEKNGKKTTIESTNEGEFLYRNVQEGSLL